MSFHSTLIFVILFIGIIIRSFSSDIKETLGIEKIGNFSLDQIGKIIISLAILLGIVFYLIAVNSAEETLNNAQQQLFWMSNQ